MMTFPLVQRVDRLEARVARIERLFDLPPVESSTPPAPPPDADESPAAPVAPATTPVAAKVDAVDEPVAPPLLDQRDSATTDGTSDAAPAAPPTVVPTHKQSATSRLFTTAARSPSDATSRRGFDFGWLEEHFAGKWMAYIGSLVVVIGAGLLAKLAYDAGLWGMISPAIRCVLLGLFGGALVGGGEYTLRKWGRPAAVGLFSAGIGVWFITAYATAAWYQLLPEFGAWLLMALVAAAGFVLTARTRSLTIGVLTLIAAYATPLLMHRAANDPIVLPLYLTAVFSVPLALSAFRPRPFRPLRFVALGGQALLGAVWLLWRADAWQTVVFFGGIWWAMVAAESIYAAHRKQSRAGNALATLIGTALFVTGACIAIHTSLTAAAPYWSGGLTLCVAALAVVAAVQFGDGIEPLRTKPETALSVLTLAMWLQAGVLTVVAAALLLDHLALTIAWLAVAIATIEVGRRLRSTLTDAFGLIVLALAAGKAVTIDALMASPLAGGATVLLDISGVLRLTDYSLLLFGAVAALITASYRIRPGTHHVRRIWPAALFFIAVLFWLITTGLAFANLWMTGIWLLAAALLLTWPQLGVRQHFASVGVALGLLTLAKWMLIDTATVQLTARSDDATLAFMNAPFLFGLILAGSVSALWYRTRQRQGVSPLHAIFTPAVRSTLPALVAIIIAWALGFEIERLIGRFVRSSSTPWPFGQLLGYWLLTMIGIVGLSLSFTARRLRATVSQQIGLVFLLGAGLLWLTFGTGLPRLSLGIIDATPFLNPRFASGLLLAGLIATAYATLRERDTETSDNASSADGRAVSGVLPAFTAILLFAALGYEAEIMVEESMRNASGATWSAAHLLGFWLIMLAGVIGTALAFVARRLGTPISERIGIAFVIAAAGAWLSVLTLVPRILAGTVDATPFLNPQFASGALLVVLIVAVIRGLWRDVPLLSRSNDSEMNDEETDEFTRTVRRSLLTLLGLLPLWLGSLEVDRFLPDAISIYWGLYGIGLVIIGWIRPVPVIRHAGLALLFITLGKVLIVDTAQLTGIARPISYLAIGLLFVLTSIGYARLSPKLAERTSRPMDGVKPPAAESQPVVGDEADDGIESSGDQPDAAEDNR